MGAVASRSRIPRGVWLLGWASLFTDAAGEMIYPLLPAYLSLVLGAGAMSLGVIEGLAEAVNSFVKILSGRRSDRLGRRRPLVIAGYSLSSLARPLIALTTAWPQVLAIRVLDRTGKGVRSAPRDALLARFARVGDRGRIYGFHSAMDHTGAIIGPLLATVVLYLTPDGYRFVFALAAVPGVLAVAMLFLVDEDQPAAPLAPRAVAPSPAERRVSRPGASSPLVAFLWVVLVFSLGNSADAFLLLRLTDALGGVTFVPVLWAGLHVVKASLSTWGGTLSDRFGRRPVIVVGWAVYAVVYLGFALSTSAAAYIGWFLAYGVYFALTEGAEKALVADLTPKAAQGTAFGYYNATLGVGALLASVLFGLLYQRLGAPVAFGTGAAFAGLASLLLLLMRTPGDKLDGSDASDSRYQ
jgi:MFS family permease